MKKSIWAVLLAAIVCLFCVSCSKTTTNTSKLVGTWKIVKETVTYNGASRSEPFSDNVTLQFVKGGDFVVTKTHGDVTYSYAGSWFVVDDYVTATYSLGSRAVTRNSRIESVDSKSLILSYTELSGNTPYTYTHALVKQ